MFLLAAVVSGEDFTEAEQKDMLARHNQKRCMAGVPLLEWDDDLAAGASSWAANTGTDHSPGSKYSGSHPVEFGENIHMNCPEESAETAVTWWYDEIKKYNEAQPFAAAHYTAMVWKGSTKLGCGKGPACNPTNPAGKFVCRLHPPGNNPYPEGNYAKNVIAPTETEEECPLAASSRLYDDSAAPSVASWARSMLLPTLAVFAMALLVMGAVAARQRRGAKPHHDFLQDGGAYDSDVGTAEATELE